MGLSRAGWAAPKSESGHHRLHHKQPPSSQLFSPNDAATLPQRQRSQPLSFSPGPPPKLKSCHNMPGPSPILGIISTLPLYPNRTAALKLGPWLYLLTCERQRRSSSVHSDHLATSSSRYCRIKHVRHSCHSIL